MVIVLVVAVVGLIAVAVMWAVGTGAGGRSRARRDGGPEDVAEVTETDVRPPAHPDRPVPGSAPDRARKGEAGAPDGSEVARRRG